MEINLSPYTIEVLSSLDPTIVSSISLVFKSKLLVFIRPVQRSVYNVFNPQSLKFLTRLHLGLSHLNERRFRRNFKDCINPLCSWCSKVESTLYFFLHCLHYSTFRMYLTDKVNQINEKFHTYLMIIKEVTSFTLKV